MFKNKLNGLTKEPDDTNNDINNDIMESAVNPNGLSINSWVSDGFEFIEQDIPLEVVDESYYSNIDNNTEDNKTSLDEAKEEVDNITIAIAKEHESDEVFSIQTQQEEVPNNIDSNFTIEVSPIIQNENDVEEEEPEQDVYCGDIENTSHDEIINDGVEGDSNIQNKSLKAYYIFGGVCLSLVLFFGVSYLLWFLDNENVQGVVSGVIAETTSKHNLTVTDDKVIEDIQIGQVFDFLEVDFEPLIKRNSDTQGYLKVKGVEGLEYPVMQTMDNEYYLDKDIDRNKSGAGWLFADCRNSLDFMQFNTIIYGHNRVDGLMFGNLKQLTKTDINTKPDADKIYFNTRNSQMIYEICSIYVTTYDDWQYYDVDFSEDGKQSFIDRLNKLNQVPVFKRSDLSTMDNFLTLSTCHGSAGTEKRLVVHARLVAIK